MAEDIKYIVRIASTDLDGKKGIGTAITKIKGVGNIFSNAVCKKAGIDSNKKAGSLSDAEIKKIDEIISDPVGNGFPDWMLNRRKDYETGEERHILSADIRFIQGNDKKRMQKIKSYKGMRHAVGLTVRGQQTKSNFRRQKGKVQGEAKKKGKSGRV